MGTIVLLDLMGGVALLLWGLHMVQSGVLRAFGADLRRVLSKADAILTNNLALAGEVSRMLYMTRLTRGSLDERMAAARWKSSPSRSISNI